MGRLDKTGFLSVRISHCYEENIEDFQQIELFGEQRIRYWFLEILD